MNAAPRHPRSQARDDRSGDRAIQHRRLEGQVLGGFRLAREIASGGMAAVYLAHRTQHARIGQAAAVKVIHAHLARDEDFVEMFLDEARIASCITHPNVCRVLDFGIADETYYLAMEYVMGETLADVLARVSASPEAQQVEIALLAQVVVQVCEGLHAAHEARDPQGNPLNIVHRDISPQNIMVGYDGSVRVVDFGVASASERLHSTRNGKIKGRLAYMAPEQMRGMHTDRRADLWSLGVLMWEGFSGQRLFRRDDEIKTIAAVTREPIPSLSNCGSNVPMSLQRIVTRCLMRDRESRFATARDLGLALSRSATTSLPRMGMPEVSVWMQALFGDRIEQKRALMREAADAAEAAARPKSAVPTERTDSRPPEGTATRISVPRRTPRPVAPSQVRPPVRSRLRSRALMTLITMLALAVPTPCGAPSMQRWLSHAELRPEPELAARSVSPASRAAETGASQRTAHGPAEPPTQAPAAPPPLSATTNVRAAGTEVVSEAKPKSAATEAPTARTQQVGQLTVIANKGWAEVYLGDRKLGSTPLRVWLPLGLQPLRVVPFGRGAGVTRLVEVNEENSARLNVSFDRRPVNR